MRMTWKFHNRQNDRERDWSGSENCEICEILFWLLREFGFRNLEIVDHFDKYLLLEEEPVRWIAKSVLVYKSLNLTLPDVFDDDCLMQPDFGGILKSVSLSIDKCWVWLPAGQSLHQHDQNGCGAHTASWSVGTVGSAGAWSSLLTSVECRCYDCITFMVCVGTTLTFLSISIIASQQIVFSVKSKPWNEVLLLKLVFPQLVSKFPAFYIPI